MLISKAEEAEKEIRRSGPLGKVKAYLKALGPGLITGASDELRLQVTSIIRLIQNAFIKSILPGFEKEVSEKKK
ncbi:MAG: hypothetical protein ACXU9L_06710 [Thermodesulfobacteriota bacterium]